MHTVLTVALHHEHSYEYEYDVGYKQSFGFIDDSSIHVIFDHIGALRRFCHLLARSKQSLIKLISKKTKYGTVRTVVSSTYLRIIKKLVPVLEVRRG